MADKVDTQKEIIFGSSDPNVSRVLSKKEKNGELCKVAPRIYTTNLKAIVDSGIPMTLRDEDSHDILETFKILSNRAEMTKTPASPDELFAILSHRHSVLLEGRPHINPGIFKMKNNRAEMAEFVDHQLVIGTLSQGFKYYAALTDPFARALCKKEVLNFTPVYEPSANRERIIIQINEKVNEIQRIASIRLDSTYGLTG